LDAQETKALTAENRKDQFTRVTLNSASDYRTGGLYRTPNPSLLVH